MRLYAGGCERLSSRVRSTATRTCLTASISPVVVSMASDTMPNVPCPSSLPLLHASRTQTAGARKSPPPAGVGSGGSSVRRVQAPLAAPAPATPLPPARRTHAGGGRTRRGGTGGGALDPLPEVLRRELDVALLLPLPRHELGKLLNLLSRVVAVAEGVEVLGPVPVAVAEGVEVIGPVHRAVPRHHRPRQLPGERPRQLPGQRPPPVSGPRELIGRRLVLPVRPARVLLWHFPDATEPKPRNSDSGKEKRTSAPRTCWRHEP